MYKSFERSKGFKRFKKMFGFLLAKKPTIVYRGSEEEFDSPTIFLSNHGLDGSRALYVNEIYFPFKFAPIGQFEVFQSFRKRWTYLYTFNQRLRRGLSRFKAFCAATFEGVFSKTFYKFCRAIPSYKDHRLKNTFDDAFRCLDEGISLMMYPENLMMGYNNVFVEYLSGFVAFAKSYYKKYKKEVKVCAVFNNHSTRQLLIDTPISVINLLDEGKTKEEIAKVFSDRTNKLYIDYVIPIHQKAEEKYKTKYKTDKSKKVM